MKKILLFISMAFILVGCASKEQNLGYIQTSSPLFIQNMPTQKRLFVDFTNTSNVDTNLTQAVKLSLAKSGYEVVPMKEMANVIIRGNLNFFKRTTISNFENGGVSFGFGFGSWSDRFGFGVNSYPYNIYSNLVYNAQVSLLIEIKNNKTPKSYETNLNYQSPKGWDDINEVKAMFNKKIIEQIKSYLGVRENKII